MKAPGKYISVLDMHFKDSVKNTRFRIRGQVKRVISFLLLIVITYSFSGGYCFAELVERVVAIVNSEVIMYTEFQEEVREARETGKETSKEEILDKIIERLLILEQAKKFFMGANTYRYYKGDELDRKLVDDYIEKRIKSLIHVSFEEIENYYDTHSGAFKGKDLYQSWDEIESELRDGKLGKKLREHIASLKDNAYIRIQLKQIK